MTTIANATAATETRPAAVPASVSDAGKVRLGGLATSFPPASVSDAGKVRLGGLSPTF